MTVCDACDFSVSDNVTVLDACDMTVSDNVTVCDACDFRVGDSDTVNYVTYWGQWPQQDDIQYSS